MELVVAVGIFAAVIALGSGLFISVLRAQHNAEQNQNVADNARSALEIMSRAIRVSTTDTTLCGGASSCGPISTMRISSPTLGSCAAKPCPIVLERSTNTGLCGGSNACVVQDDDGIAGPNPFVPVTNQQMKVSRLDFYISGLGTSESPNLQPRVTIVLEAEGTSQRPGERAKLNLQTTVTSRALDI